MSNPTDTAIATRYVCAKNAEEALEFSEGGQSHQTLEDAYKGKFSTEVDFEIIVIARRIKP